MEKEYSRVFEKAVRISGFFRTAANCFNPTKLITLPLREFQSVRE
jgi:hypothetical protein